MRSPVALQVGVVKYGWSINGRGRHSLTVISIRQGVVYPYDSVAQARSRSLVPLLLHYWTIELARHSLLVYGEEQVMHAIGPSALRG